MKAKYLYKEHKKIQVKDTVEGLLGNMSSNSFLTQGEVKML